MGTKRKAVFLDKDGTLIHNVPYNVEPEKVAFVEDAFPALTALHEEGYDLVMITNQPGIALGLFSFHDFENVSRFIESELTKRNIPLKGVYFCPHHPEGVIPPFGTLCHCRKPAPGMLLRAANELDVDLTRSWFIGDILNDVEAGNAAGCRTILIDNGNETEWLLSPKRVPTLMAKSLGAAARYVLGQYPTEGGLETCAQAKTI